MITSFPVLSLTVFCIPLVAAILMVMLPERYLRSTLLALQLLQLLMATWMMAGTDFSHTGFHWMEEWPWSRELHLSFSMGVDGISAPFLLINALVMLTMTVSGWNSMPSHPRLVPAMLMLLHGLINGVYVSLDLGMFFLCWELLVLPVVVLVMCYNPSYRGQHAAIRYGLFMFLGGLPLLLAILLLATGQPHVDGMVNQHPYAFDYLTLLDHPVASSVEPVVFLLMLLAFMIKIPIVPLHGWLPVLTMESPASVIAMVTSFKIGLYGVLRLLLPLAGRESLEYGQWLMAAGLLSALYAVLAGLRQSNLRSTLAYVSISHAGMVFASLFALNAWSMDGAVLQLLNFACAGSAMFILLGYLYNRTGTHEILHLGGLATSMPRLHGIFLLLLLSYIAVPGTLGFPAELMMLAGIFRSHTGYGVLASFVSILNIACMLRLYRQAFQGSCRFPVSSRWEDLRPREWLILSPLLMILLTGGIAPQKLIQLGQTALHAILEQVHESGSRGEATSYALNIVQ